MIDEQREFVPPAPSGRKTFIPEDSDPLLVRAPPKGKDSKFALTSLALWFIAATIVAVMIVFLCMPFDGTVEISKVIDPTFYKAGPPADSSRLDRLLDKQMELVKHMESNKKDYREFFLKICQMIFLNLLLPIFTAIVGYKIGAAKRGN